MKITIQQEAGQLFLDDLNTIPGDLAEEVVKFARKHKSALLAELGNRQEAEFDDLSFDACNARRIPAEDYQALVDTFNRHLPHKVIYLHIYLEQKQQMKRA